MAYRKNYKRKYRRMKRRARGKFYRKRSFSTRVKKVLMKAAETKYIDGGENQVTLWHNVGASTTMPIIPFVPRSLPGIFNIWATAIFPGTGRDQRIGDKITPRGMALYMNFENMADRPNTKYRVIVAQLPKEYGGTVTGPVFDPFQNTGVGNRLLLAADKDKGVKFLYDKIITLNTQSIGLSYPQNNTKRGTKYMKLWIKRKKANDIVFNQNLQQIVNKPISLYVIPYEEFSTYETDIVGKMDYRVRLYWKDV